MWFFALKLSNDVIFFALPARLGQFRLSSAMLFFDHRRNHVTIKVVLAGLVVEVYKLFISPMVGLLRIGTLFRCVDRNNLISQQIWLIF